jgi:tetratricopeptide (TPR) repeat protein
MTFVATVSRGLPDLPQWRALPIWWREALGQTERYASGNQLLLDSQLLPCIELAVQPQGSKLTATLHQGNERQVLWTASFGPDSATPDLLLAIDYLAWCTRLALGEAAKEPKSIAAITSRNPKVVTAVDDANKLMMSGGFASSHRALRVARQRDGGSPFVLDRLSSLELLRGDADAAERISREALIYTNRVSPTVQHRLARTLLMSRSAGSPAQAARHDLQLATLAKVARRERPHDEEPLWTAALAHNFLGEFEAARPLLEKLRLRQPDNPFIPYHLGWACLGMDDAKAAAGHLADAAIRLPAPWVLLPRAIALFESGRHVELEALLVSVSQEHGRDGRDSLTHQVLRMQAAHAILQNQPGRARQLLLDDLHWLQEHPVALSRRVGEFAESGALLTRLGSSKELPVLLGTIQKQNSGTIVADACAFIGGMHQVQTTGVRAEKIEKALSRDGDSPWSALLAAFAHERSGEVGEMQTTLARAARLSDSPMTKALLAKSLRAVGKMREAERLHETMRRELVQLRLRQTCQHPLFGPELAYAYILK